MVQPPVLPSNAPPLSDTDSIAQSRVLQEHSGNRQFGEPCYENASVNQKYAPTLLEENAHPSYPAQLHLPHGLHHVYQQTSPVRQQPQYGRTYLDDQFRAKNEKTARFLYHRFQASEGYRKYRDRQKKDDKKDDELKWPDRLELAFFEGTLELRPFCNAAR